MAGSVNKVILIGNLGRDPEIRHTNDSPIANLSVATSNQWRDRSSGERRKTEWHRVVIFDEKFAGCAVPQVRRFTSKVSANPQVDQALKNIQLRSSCSVSAAS